jgi:hypothetical protein
MIRPIKIFHHKDDLMMLSAYLYKCFICNNQPGQEFYVVERFDYRIGEKTKETRQLKELACSKECAEMIVLQNI